MGRGTRTLRIIMSYSRPHSECSSILWLSHGGGCQEAPDPGQTRGSRHGHRHAPSCHGAKASASSKSLVINYTLWHADTLQPGPSVANVTAKHLRFNVTMSSFEYKPLTP